MGAEYIKLRAEVFSGEFACCVFSVISGEVPGYKFVISKSVLPKEALKERFSLTTASISNS